LSVTFALSWKRFIDSWEATMPKKRKKRTPEEIAQERAWRRKSDENLRRLRELVDRGWAELEERRRREAASGA
jgi:hypothetical protein